MRALSRYALAFDVGILAGLILAAAYRDLRGRPIPFHIHIPIPYVLTEQGEQA
jgi:hypothetical protein